MDNNSKTGVGIGGLCLVWGLITQSLKWAGVIDWSLLAIWGPFLLSVAIAVIALLVALIASLITAILDR